MKLGIAYNIFDGEEMLPFAIKNLRPFADFIVVVYQTTSNYGNPANPKLEQHLQILKTAGLIDRLFHYTPEFEYNDDNSLKGKKQINWRSGTKNEIKKREIGLKICRANNCDTYMTLDCDELYDHQQFEWAMKDFEKGNYDTSFTNLLTYYKLPTMEIRPYEKWYQPLFYKIKEDTKFQMQDNYVVHIDRTKMVKAGHSRIYTREEIQQYHYAYVRHNLISKIENSSAQSNNKSKKEILNHYDQWKGKEDGALFIANQKFNLVEVENKFNIQLKK